MSKTPIPSALRIAVAERAQNACEYCHLPEGLGFTQYEVDHVIAEQHGGNTDPNNLAYACIICNRHKGTNLASIDPQTGERAWLYNPRTQLWHEHFQLNHDGIINGLTEAGRATIFLLEFNTVGRIDDRRELIALGKLYLQRQ
jgi:homogentisate 1,2-dioxygenase